LQGVYSVCIVFEGWPLGFSKGDISLTYYTLYVGIWARGYQGRGDLAGSIILVI
jgi:hypothetical protein